MCGEPGTTQAGTLDRVAALVDKSMVVAVEHAGVTRYRMLETLRAYARERDDGTGRRLVEIDVRNDTPRSSMLVTSEGMTSPVLR